MEKNILKKEVNRLVFSPEPTSISKYRKLDAELVRYLQDIEETRKSASPDVNLRELDDEEEEVRAYQRMLYFSTLIYSVFPRPLDHQEAIADVLPSAKALYPLYEHSDEDAAFLKKVKQVIMASTKGRLDWEKLEQLREAAKAKQQAKQRQYDAFNASGINNAEEELSLQGELNLWRSLHDFFRNLLH